MSTLNLTRTSGLGLILVLLISSISLINGLKCKCDICLHTNYTCETDGFCFKTVKLSNNTFGDLIYSYRCLARHQVNPPGSMFQCNNNFHVGKGCSGRRCCNSSSGDFCNAHLNVECVFDPLAENEQKPNPNMSENAMNFSDHVKILIMILIIVACLTILLLSKMKVF